MSLSRKHFDESQSGPLDGVRVLDLSRLVAGNMVTHVLADFGADVIKVERPGHGDDLRNWRVADEEVFWKVYSRNKRSIELDIKAAHGREALLRLIAGSHALVENFVPGTLERFDLAPARLWQENPNLILAGGEFAPVRACPGNRGPGLLRRRFDSSPFH